MTTIDELDQQIVSCRRCPRLVEWRERVAREKRAAFADEVYWGRPVPGLGVTDPQVLVVGLAPAAHGANRTGRLFTGETGVAMMTELRGASNAKAKRELGWQPIWPSWRDGFRRGLDTPVPLPARARTPARETSAA